MTRLPPYTSRRRREDGFSDDGWAMVNTARGFDRSDPEELSRMVPLDLVAWGYLLIPKSRPGERGDFTQIHRHQWRLEPADQDTSRRSIVANCLFHFGGGCYEALLVLPGLPVVFLSYFQFARSELSADSGTIAGQRVPL